MAKDLHIAGEHILPNPKIIDYFKNNKIKVGFAVTGSYCTLSKSVEEMSVLKKLGAHVTPILSYNVRDFDSKFGSASHFRKAFEDATGNNVIDTINAAEPIGPKKLFDIVVVAPCSGNSLAKLANGISDTPTLMAVKAHLRNDRPVIIAASSNDGLAVNFANIGKLMNYKNVFFVPFGQDDHEAKINSLVASFELIPETIMAALENRQKQPVLV